MPSQHALLRVLAHPSLTWALLALSACSQGEAPSDRPEVPTAVLPIVAERPDQDPMRGMAGNGVGPGVEPPSTPTPEPPDTSPSAGVPDPVAPPPATGAAGNSGNQSGEMPTNEPTGGSAMAPSPGQCVLATRLDTCCGEVVPADAAAIAADPCLVPYDLAGDYPAELVATCQAALGDQCATVRCAAPRPRSFVVTRGADGVCAFADECSTPAECALAANWHDECACVGTWPRSLVQGDACLVELGADQPQGCPGGPGLLCPCALPTAPSCVQDGELHVCR